MKLELKAIRYNSLLSKETHCFTALVYLNGKLAAHIESDGHGAAPDISYTDPTTKSFLLKHFRSQPMVTLAGDYNGPYSYQPDIETWAGDEVNTWLKKRSCELAKRLPKKSASEYRIVD